MNPGTVSFPATPCTSMVVVGFPRSRPRLDAISVEITESCAPVSNRKFPFEEVTSPTVLVTFGISQRLDSVIKSPGSSELSPPNGINGRFTVSNMVVSAGL